MQKHHFEPFGVIFFPGLSIKESWVLHNSSRLFRQKFPSRELRYPLAEKNPPYSFEKAPRSTSEISKLCPNPYFLLDILETVMNATSKYFMLLIKQQLCNSKTIDWTLIQPQRNHFHHQPIRFMAAQLWKSTCRFVSLEWISFSEEGENEAMAMINTSHREGHPHNTKYDNFWGWGGTFSELPNFFILTETLSFKMGRAENTRHLPR